MTDQPQLTYEDVKTIQRGARVVIVWQEGETTGTFYAFDRNTKLAIIRSTDGTPCMGRVVCVLDVETKP